MSAVPSPRPQAIEEPVSEVSNSSCRTPSETDAHKQDTARLGSKYGPAKTVMFGRDEREEPAQPANDA